MALAFGAVIALAVLVVLIGITRMSDITDSLTLIGSDRVPKVVKVSEITDEVNLIARELRNALIVSDDSKVSAALEAVLAARGRIGKTLEALAPTITTEEARNAWPR